MIKKYTLFVSLFMLTLVSCDQEEITDLEEINDLTITDQIFTLINQHRKEQGLAELSKNSTAEELAEQHTSYMISIDDINHDNFNDRSKILVEKESSRAAAENVASGYPNASRVVQAWLDSPEHRENIEGDFSHTGIAAIKNEKGQFFYTQIFYRK